MSDTVFKNILCGIFIQIMFLKSYCYTCLVCHNMTVPLSQGLSRTRDGLLISEMDLNLCRQIKDKWCLRVCLYMYVDDGRRGGGQIVHVSETGVFSCNRMECKLELKVQSHIQ